MSLKGIAKETVKILEEGRFINSVGNVVEFLAAQQAAISATILYRPEQCYQLLDRENSGNAAQQLIVEVTDETTQVAAHRLVHLENCSDLVLLNYASARNAGGGFINGAKAQEEDLCRCSGLYPCLLTQPDYYTINRATDSLLYTDHVIYSPQVPWFRLRSRELLDYYFLASVITAPAPNAGEALRRDNKVWPQIETDLRRRAGIVLAIAREQGHRNLLLGAWGCGVFRNIPSMVADAFGSWLESPRFQGCFDRVVFAVYDPSADQHNLQAFRKRFK